MMKFLVIGCGSIGQRHIKNLKFLGTKNIEIFDTDFVLSQKIAKKFLINAIKTIDFKNYDCVFICTPPKYHISLALEFVKSGVNVFIEKPLSNSLLDLNKLKKLSEKNSTHIFVGYVFRFDKGLRQIKKLLHQNKIGNIISVDAYEGWYLPNWRPWQNYRESYTGSTKLGGGIILDGSHELNYLLWLNGKINQVFSYYINVQKLKVNAEGLAEILLRFKSNTIGRIHLDFLNPKYSRRCEIIGDKGSIRWFFEDQTYEIQKSGEKKFRKIKYDTDMNAMYLDEIKYVLQCLKGKENKQINLSDAIDTLKISLAIKKSGKINKPILIKN